MQYQQLEDSDSKEPRHIQSQEINRNTSTGEAQPLMSHEIDEKAALRKKRIKWGIIGGLILIVVVLAIVLPLTLIHHDDPAPPFDPHGPLGPGAMNPYQTQPGSIVSGGQGYMVKGQLKVGKLTTPDQLLKMAHQVVPKEFLQASGLEDTVKAKGVDWRNMNFFGENNKILQNLEYLVDSPSNGFIRVLVTDMDSSRFRVPPNMLNMPEGNPTYRLENMGFHLSQTDAFAFTVQDVKDPNNWYIDTRQQALIFADKYIQMDMKFPSQVVYGLGDRVHQFRLNPGAYSLWSSGQDPSYDSGRGRGGLSGVHPFIMVQTKQSRRFIGISFRNSNAMTPVLRFNDDGTSTFSFITIGGELEFYITAMGTAHQVIQSYQNIIGHAQLPPYWALGWQEASPNPSGGVNNQDSVAQAVKAYSDQGLPLEAVYLQADSWDQTVDFKLDSGKFQNINQLSTQLKAKNQRLVAYIDSAVNVKDRSKNTVYVNGKSAGAFIKTTVSMSNPDGYLINSKQGKQVVYLDWLSAQCPDFWSLTVKNYASQVPFDGLWTTMNEPFGDVSGEIVSTPPSREKNPSRDIREILEVGGEESPYDQSWFYSFWPLKNISTYFLPFIPQFQEQGNYDAKTLSLNATHAFNYLEYDVHSLYAHAMMNATNEGAKMGNDNRPFILTKGSFTSTGRYTAATAHTNNERSWSSLYFGLQSVLRSQMFGLPLSGTDVCGYKSSGDNLDEELCLRWYQLATFFPLARHSQDATGARTEPYMFKTYQNQVKKTMHDRMQYLRLLYTCMFETTDSGGTCLDPIEFRYAVSSDKFKSQLPDVTNSFLFAGSLLVSPIMNATNGATTFPAYFPAGNWVNMADWTVVQGKDDYVQLNVQDTVNVHLAPGALIPFQNNSNMALMTSADTIQAPITLIANRDQNGVAGGSLFLDQGQLRSEMDNTLYEYYSINVQANSIQFQGAGFNKGNQPHVLDQIVLVNAADLSEVNFACYYPVGTLEAQMMNPYFDTAKNALYLKGDGPLKFSQIQNIYYGSSNKGDVNLCQNKTSGSARTFDYNIIGGVIPNLVGAQSVSMNLSHMGNMKFDNITVNISFFDTGVINVRYSWMNATNGKRQVLKVPDTVVNTTASRDPSTIQDTLDKYIDIKDQPFQIIFKTRLTLQNETVYSITGFIFDEYLNWVNAEANAMPADSEDDFRGIFGLGERSQKDFFMRSGVYSMWAKDIDNPTENGKLPGKEVYGAHPFYMFKHKNNSWVGVYHNNAQAQDWWINNNYTSGKVSISTITTGGYGDIYVFVSSQKPESIIAKYHSMVGTPVLVPQWALGWNQCRYGYLNVDQVKASTYGYIDNGIPLDGQWVDIDYMQDYKDFTVNEKDFAGAPGAFAGLAGFVDQLHQMNMRFVPIIDAGVAMRPGQNYAAYDQGVAQDVFIKDPTGALNFGKVWPNEAVYPDWFADNAGSWWGSQLDAFQQSLKFDGLWQDMNEASNFCNGLCQKDVETVSQSVIYKLPYTPTGESIQTKAISLDAQQAQNYTQLDAHSLFGTQQVKASFDWFQKQNKRPMIISRSSFAGHGKYGSKWLGDNHNYIDDLEESVLGVMKMNMFGVTLVGADICGFGGSYAANVTLCTRWHQVAAFQPFSRNHRTIDFQPQEPYMFNTTIYDGNVTYTDLMKEAIYRKYHLMRYYYTQMSQISYGNNTYYTVYKPLFFEFPDDTGAFSDIANNVMIGPALKTSINARSVSQPTTDFYFPAGTWCSLFEPIGECMTFNASATQTLPSRLNESFVHLREGYVIPMQNATALKARNVVDLQNAPVDLHVLGQYKVPGVMNWQAEGLYVNDDGLTTNLQGNVNQYVIKAQYSRTGGETISLTIKQNMVATNFMNAQTNCSNVNQADFLQSIYIYNAMSFKQHDTFFVQVAYEDDIESYQTIGTASYDAETDRIVFDGSLLKNYLCLTRVFRVLIRNLS